MIQRETCRKPSSNLTAEIRVDTQHLLLTHGCHYNSSSNSHLFSISDGLRVAAVLFQLTIFAKEKWLFGPIFCSIYLATQNICAFASPVFVTLITFDRYVAICHPMATPFGRKFFYSATILTWLVATSLSVPYMAILDSYMPARIDTKSGPHCFYHSLEEINYFQLFTVATAIRFLFPLWPFANCFDKFTSVEVEITADTNGLRECYCRDWYASLLVDFLITYWYSAATQLTSGYGQSHLSMPQSTQ